MFATNGIHLCFTITPTTIDKCYSKYKIIFDRQIYKEVIELLKNIEEDVLKQVGIEDKIPHYKITEQVKYGHLKLSVEEGDTLTLNKELTIILKISGVWETDANYGVTYKFSSQ